MLNHLISRRRVLQGVAVAIGASIAAPFIQKRTAYSMSATKSAAQSLILTPFSVQTPEWAASYDLASADYQRRFDELVAQGYRLIWVQGGPDAGDGAVLSAIWVRDGANPWVAHHDMSSSDYQTLFDEYGSAGYFPLCVSGYQDGSSVRFAAVWQYDPTVGYWAVHDRSNSDYQAFFNEAAAQGYNLQVVDGYAQNGEDNYAAIFTNRGVQDWSAVHGVNAADYQAFFDSYAPQGYRPLSVSGYQVNGDTRFAAVLVRDGGNWVARHALSTSGLANQVVSLGQNDYQPISLSGYKTADQREFAAAWLQKSRSWQVTGEAEASLASFDAGIQQFMQARNISCGALAVTKESRLVLARGYRWQREDQPTVQPTSRFRIASLSKPITATAILKLVQAGRLQLSDRLVDWLNLVPPTGQVADARLADITLLHLLQHLGGWDRDLSFDPMVSRDAIIAADLGISLPITRDHIITYMSGQPLDFTPGTRYAYSNFGYCLLGRVIEAVSEQPYSDFVQQEVLAPLSITRMQLGNTLFQQQAAEEVTYATKQLPLFTNLMDASLPQNVMLPYGNFNLENMDSHGGWLASAVDLARFATAFDQTGGYPLLQPGWLDTMFAQPAIGIHPNGLYYGCGWQVRPYDNGKNTWHTGSLPGTTTLMVRRRDGVNWIALFNQRQEPSESNYIDALDPLLHVAADAVIQWPTYDLFPNYGL